MYVGRFAPTPSGDLHFGSLVTAIASYCDAKRVGGQWLIKIDDIDKQRVKKNSVQSILETLESLNLFWDSTESYQSNRLDEYRFYFEKLSATHQTYNCSCSRKYLSWDITVDGALGYNLESFVAVAKEYIQVVIILANLYVALAFYHFFFGILSSLFNWIKSPYLPFKSS